MQLRGLRPVVQCDSWECTSEPTRLSDCPTTGMHAEGTERSRSKERDQRKRKQELQLKRRMMMKLMQQCHCCCCSTVCCLSQLRAGICSAAGTRVRVQ